MSLGTTTRSLMRAAKKRFPGATDADLRRFALLQVDTALNNLSNTFKDDDLLRLADAAFIEAVDAGEAWAVALDNSVRDNIVKPLVDKARNAGVDPIPVVVVETGLPREQVAAMIEALDAKAADSVAAGLDESDTDTDDAVLAAETDAPALATASY
jgi:hypothetical protein